MRCREIITMCLLAGGAALPAAAQVCNPVDMLGPYGLQLAGSTTIAGGNTPIAVVGRVVLDGKGNVSGVSSVNFNGLFLGNPVTGTYEAKADCSVTLNLQDDSGAYQHFSGKAESGGNRVQISQTDAGAGARGTLVRSASQCSAADLRGQFQLTMSGNSTPLSSGGTGSSVSARAMVTSDGAGSLTVVRGTGKTSGTYTLDADCFVEADMGVPDGDSSTLIKIRGVLVNGGNDLIAVERDPEWVVSVKLSK